MEANWAICSRGMMRWRRRTRYRIILNSRQLTSKSCWELKFPYHKSYFFTTTSSVRRFLARPSSVSFEARGFSEP